MTFVPSLRLAERSAKLDDDSRARDARDRLARRLSAGALGMGAVLVGRTLLTRALILKLRRDVRALNAGNYRPTLSSFAEDAVLCFNDGEHRWAGEHRGKAAIARFLRNYVNAGLEGEIRELHITGAPWRMTVFATFEDRAHDSAGNEIYRNRVALLARTRCGRIVRHEDFFQDTGRLATLEARLSELGVQPVVDPAHRTTHPSS